LRGIRADIQAMHAYKVQPAGDMLKLDAMENPFLLPPDLQAALGDRLGRLPINRYPADCIPALKDALAAYVDLPPGYALMLGNGSDELIALLALVCAKPGARVLAPEPGFVMYAMSAQLQGLGYTGVPLTPDFELDESAMADAIAREQPALVYLAYPNNPTANLWDDGVIRRLISQVRAYGGLVVMDEAYQPFASRTWLDAIRRDPKANSHVLLLRTLSKFGLAGVRLGYLLAPQALVHEIDKARPPYNISVLNAECALFALEHAPVFAQQAAVIRAERDLLLAKLAKLADLPGVQVFPSQANMLLLRLACPPGRASAVFEGLKARGVLVKNVSTMHSLLANCLRLTVGSPDQNAQLLAALRAALTQGNP
jgi:histidinol-phosphate aminotransferase